MCYFLKGGKNLEKNISNIDSKTLIKSLTFLIVFWSATALMFYLAYQVTQKLNLTEILTSLMNNT